MNPTTKSINDLLDSLTLDELPKNHPRRMARERVREWKSNAEIAQLPITNIHDDKGAKVLHVDVVLGHDCHQRLLGRKV